MAFIGRKPTNAPLTSDDIPNGIIGAADLATGLSKLTWDTSVKTSGFTASANTGYFCNTTSAAFTVTLPASPTAGDTIILVDYAGTFATNNLTISPNGNKINGGTGNKTLSTNKEAVTITYVDSTQGWIPTSGINETVGVSATGGSEIKTVNGYKYHLFDSSSTFAVTTGGSVQIAVIGAGGGGGSNGTSTGNGGGGGAGAKEPASGYTTQTLTAGNYTVTIASGGAASTSGSTIGGTPSATSFAGTSTISALGGGGGGSDTSPNNSAGGAGGSGGGTYGNRTGAGGTASGSNTNAGGNCSSLGGPAYGAGGGGGATAVGGSGTSSNGGAGGQGLALTSIDSNLTSANFTTFTGMTHVCSGGGGAVDSGTAASGGTGGGNGGVNGGGTAATSFGSGGGGGGMNGNGYKGLVIVRYAI